MTDAMYTLWDQGQRALVGGKYLAARDSLQQAESAAWQVRDAASLARIQLPLLEARRQIRYLAAEGRIEILEAEIRMCAELGIQERLVLLNQGDATLVASPAAPERDAALPVEWTASESAAIGPSTDLGLTVPLPPRGSYDGRRGLGTVARESVLIAWEALALRWQGRHPLPPASDSWSELAWLRRTLEVDPACEPVAMRLMAVAEGIERRA